MRPYDLEPFNSGILLHPAAKSSLNVNGSKNQNNYIFGHELLKLFCWHLKVFEIAVCTLHKVSKSDFFSFEIFFLEKSEFFDSGVLALTVFFNS